MFNIISSVNSIDRKLNGLSMPSNVNIADTDGANSANSVPDDFEAYWLEKVFNANIEEAQKQRDWSDLTNSATRDFNAQQSQLQRDWQAGQNQEIMNFNAQQSQLQRDWQAEQNQKIMDFNSYESAVARAWQKAMRDSQFQATVKDLKAAGLNPVLAVGAQSMTPVGSSASASGGQGSSASASGGQGSSASASAVGGSAATVGGSYGYHNRSSAAGVVSSVASVVGSIGSLLHGISSFIPTSSGRYHSTNMGFGR